MEAGAAEMLDRVHESRPRRHYPSPEVGSTDGIDRVVSGLAQGDPLSDSLWDNGPPEYSELESIVRMGQDALAWWSGSAVWRVLMGSEAMRQSLEIGVVPNEARQRWGAIRRVLGAWRQTGDGLYPYAKKECPQYCKDAKGECDAVAARARAAADAEPSGDPHYEQRQVQAYNNIMKEGNSYGGPCHVCQLCHADKTQDCPPCGHGYRTAPRVPPVVPTPEWDPSLDWCGTPETESSEGTEEVPDINLGVKKCCYYHDICYGIGGSESDRRGCDAMLWACMSAFGGPLGVAAAPLYYAVLTFAGRSAFNYVDPSPVINPMGPL